MLQNFPRILWLVNSVYGGVCAYGSVGAFFFGLQNFEENYGFIIFGFFGTALAFPFLWRLIVKYESYPPRDRKRSNIGLMLWAGPFCAIITGAFMGAHITLLSFVLDPDFDKFTKIPIGIALMGGLAGLLTFPLAIPLGAILVRIDIFWLRKTSLGKTVT